MKLRKKIDLSNCTLLELAYARTGSYLKAGKLVAYVVSWGVARRELGHSPTKEEYAEFWSMNLRQAYYEQARFREAFPMLESPDRLLQMMDAQGAGAGTSGFDAADLVAA
jgi:hypothetical protein